jgi:hypothetical protein
MILMHIKKIIIMTKGTVDKKKKKKKKFLFKGLPMPLFMLGPL